MVPGNAEQQVPVFLACCRWPCWFPGLTLPVHSFRLFFSRQGEFEASQQAGAGRAVPAVPWPSDARRSPQQAAGAGHGHPRVLVVVCGEGAVKRGMGGPVPALAMAYGVCSTRQGSERGFGSSGVSAAGCASVSLVYSQQFPACLGMG